jgi:hypothetical protein
MSGVLRKWNGGCLIVLDNKQKRQKESEVKARNTVYGYLQSDIELKLLCDTYLNKVADDKSKPPPVKAIDIACEDPLDHATSSTTPCDSDDMFMRSHCVYQPYYFPCYGASDKLITKCRSCGKQDSHLTDKHCEVGYYHYCSTCCSAVYPVDTTTLSQLYKMMPDGGWVINDYCYYIDPNSMQIYHRPITTVIQPIMYASQQVHPGYQHRNIEVLRKAIDPPRI